MNSKTGGYTGRPIQKGFSGDSAQPATPPKTTGTLTPPAAAQKVTGTATQTGPTRPTK